MNRRIFIRILLVTATAAFLAHVLLFHVFTLKKLRITGNSSLSSQEVMDAAGLKLGIPIWQIDEDAIRQKINALGTVKLQDAHMRLNGILELNLCCREAVAMVVHDTDILVLDSDLCVMRRTASVPAEDLIYISGMEEHAYLLGQPYPSESKKRESCGSLLQELIRNQAQACISEIDVERMDQVALFTENGMRVQFGEAENSAGKVGFLKTVLSDLEKNDQSGGELIFLDVGKVDYRPVVQEQEFNSIS